MKKKIIALSTVLITITIIFAGCSNSKITEDMVVGSWKTSVIDYDADGKYSCLYANSNVPWDSDEIVELDLDKGGVGKIIYLSHSQESTGNMFQDAMNAAKTYYYNCEWEIENDYLKIESNECPTYVFSYSEDDDTWRLTNDDGYIYRGEFTLDDYLDR